MIIGVYRENEIFRKKNFNLTAIQSRFKIRTCRMPIKKNNYKTK